MWISEESAKEFVDTLNKIIGWEGEPTAFYKAAARVELISQLSMGITLRTITDSKEAMDRFFKFMARL